MSAPNPVGILARDVATRLWDQLGDICDDIVPSNFTEDDYNAGQIEGLSEAQRTVRASIEHHLSSVLTELGYSIVEHVPPTKDEDCGRVWLAGVMAEGFHLTTEPGRIWDFGGNEYTLAEARQYAAAMLSAVAAAEGEKQ